MDSLDADLRRLIEICKADFTKAYENYQSYGGLGWVVSDEYLGKTNQAISEFLHQYGAYSDAVNRWFKQLYSYRRSKILEDFQGCMRAIESLSEFIKSS